MGKIWKKPFLLCLAISGLSSTYIAVNVTLNRTVPSTEQHREAMRSPDPREQSDISAVQSWSSQEPHKRSQDFRLLFQKKKKKSAGKKKYVRDRS